MNTAAQKEKLFPLVNLRIIERIYLYNHLDYITSSRNPTSERGALLAVM